MNLEFVQTKQQIACCFMVDNGRIFEGPGFNKYRPIINEVEFQATTDLKMIHTKDVCNNVETYDEHNSNKRLQQSVRESKKIDVTMGDINIEPTRIMFNFTDFDIVCYNQANIPITLPKLESKKLKDLFRGNIVIMSVYRLNSPKRIVELTGVDKNYLIDILDKYKGRNKTNTKFANFLEIIEFAQQSWEQVSYMDPEYNCNMITIVTYTSIPAEAFLFKDRSSLSHQYQNLILMDYELLLSRESVFQSNINPIMERFTDIASFKDKVFHGSKFIYLIDKQNTLEDRYYISCGDIEKIPKIKNGSSQYQPDGLYIGRYDDKLGMLIDSPIPLDKIDELGYIYKTIEEATRGADKAELFNQELKEREARIRERELELKNTSVINRTEYETLIHTLRKDNEEIKAKAERDAKEQEAQFLKFKRELEANSLREKVKYENDGYTMRNYFDERKYHRDDIKYEKESFVETLKTVAATAGVIATGFMIYKQVSKAN